MVLQLHTPLTNSQGRFNGVIMAEYNAENLLRYGVPSEILAKYAVSLLDSEGQFDCGPIHTQKNQVIWNFIPGIQCCKTTNMRYRSHPVGNGLILRAQGWRTSQDLVGSGLCSGWLVHSACFDGLDVDCKLATYQKKTADAKGIGS
jgi:hypothetical protein